MSTHTSPTGVWRARSLSLTTDKTAKRYARDDAKSPYRFYYFNIMRKFAAVNRLYAFKEHKEQPDSDVTEELRAGSSGDSYGSVNKVVDEILTFHDEVGPFGELVYAGMDWVDPALTKRSMELMPGDGSHAARQCGARLHQPKIEAAN